MATSAPKFKIDTSWMKNAPPHGGVSATAFDSEGRLFALARGDKSSESAVFIFSSDGEFLSSWGQDAFAGNRPHGITVPLDGFVYVIEDFGCTVRRFTLDGKQLEVIGPSGEEHISDTGVDWSGPTGRETTFDRLAMMKVEGGPPYNHPTDLAVGPDGDLYVTDGDGNCKVHRFSPDGELKHSWGKSGIGPGEFHCVHSLIISPEEKVYVCDRDNERVQIFTLDGEFIEQWTDFGRPQSVVYGPDGLFYIACCDIKAGRRSFMHGTSSTDYPDRVVIRDSNGNEAGESFQCEGSPHSVNVDSTGNLYVTVSKSSPSLVKYTRV